MKHIAYSTLYRLLPAICFIGILCGAVLAILALERVDHVDGFSDHCGESVIIGCSSGNGGGFK